MQTSKPFAILTGCLRISKESIFTGLNNFSVYTVKDVQYNEYFGFTDAEVRQMLEYYGFMKILSFDIRKHPVNIAKFKLSFVFNA